ncbi:MAG: L-histidine N(alpha)-methyltransferase [Alphaproteobacteria bacterium]
MTAAVTSSAFARSVLEGLSRPQKRLEPKFFYDRRGSELFEEITRLEAYYPTRTERAILDDNAAAMAARIGPGAVVAEPGAGALVKARVLLGALDRPAAFAPGDISVDHLRDAAAALAADFPGLAIRPFKLDFDRDFDLPADVAAMGPVVVFFPGSTVGNFEPPAAADLLRRFAAIGDARLLLIGVDLKKDEDRLVRAYDDPEGVTAAFNLNVLARANQELGADFDLDTFRHFARYDRELGRIEMHLESRRAQRVEILGRSFDFAAGETIHTENSYKYSIPEFQALAGVAGWRPLDVWTDAERLFSVQLYARPAETPPSTM